MLLLLLFVPRGSWSLFGRPAMCSRIDGCVLSALSALYWVQSSRHTQRRPTAAHTEDYCRWLEAMGGLRRSSLHSAGFIFRRVSVQPNTSDPAPAAPVFGRRFLFLSHASSPRFPVGDPLCAHLSPLRERARRLGSPRRRPDCKQLAAAHLPPTLLERCGSVRGIRLANTHIHGATRMMAREGGRTVWRQRGASAWNLPRYLGSRVPNSDRNTTHTSSGGLQHVQQIFDGSQAATPSLAQKLRRRRPRPAAFLCRHNTGERLCMRGFVVPILPAGPPGGRGFGGRLRAA